MSGAKVVVTRVYCSNQAHPIRTFSGQIMIVVLVSGSLIDSLALGGYYTPRYLLHEDLPQFIVISGG